MSFSSEVKAELCRTALSRRCCAQAEAYGVLLYCNQFTASPVRISTESNAFAARLPALFHRAFQLSFDRTPEEGAAKRIFSITEPDKLSALWSAFGHEPAGTLAHHINFAVLEEEHCRLAFFRGAFLAGGSVTDPAKRYHLELSTPHLSVSRELRALLLECGFTPKETTRKANSITYFKQSDQIEDFLTLIGAPVAAMSVMSAKLEKDLRNSVNRRLNCDSANLDKAVEAAQEQLESIRKLQRAGLLDQLPDKLQLTAALRLENPELTLSELAEEFDPPVTKSCLNHRLRKITQLAKGL